MITVNGFRLEVHDGNRSTWMDFYSRPEFWGGYVNGVAFNPQWGIFALVKEKKGGRVCLLQFASKGFLEEIEMMKEEFEVIQVIEGEKP